MSLSILKVFEFGTLNFSTTAANWRSFTLTPGSAMSLGRVLATDLGSSSITGIGFFVQSPAVTGQGVRLDRLSVTAVSERGSRLLAGLGAIGFHVGRRRAMSA